MIITLLQFGFFIGAFVVMALCFIKKYKFIPCLFISTACFVCSFLTVPAAAKLIDDVDIITQSVDMAIEDSSALFEAALSINGDAGSDVVPSLNVLLKQVREVYLLMFPSIIIICALLLSYLLYMLVKTVRRWVKKSSENIPPFNMLGMQRSSAIALLVTFIGSFIITDTNAQAALLNIVALIAAVAIACGLAVIDYFFKRRLPYGFVRFLIYVAVFIVFAILPNVLYYMLMTLGVADAFWKFRTRSKADLL